MTARLAETLLNNAPVVGAVSLMPSAVEGQDVYVVAAFTDADGNAPFICTVDYGDGAQPGSVVSDADGNECVGPAYFYSDSGDYDVTIRVTDGYAAPGVKEETLAVANAAPVVGALDITPNPATENRRSSSRRASRTPGWWMEPGPARLTSATVSPKPA